MGILNKLVEWITEQVINALYFIITFILRTLDCNIDAFYGNFLLPKLCMKLWLHCDCIYLAKLNIKII